MTKFYVLGQTTSPRAFILAAITVIYSASSSFAQVAQNEGRGNDGNAQALQLTVIKPNGAELPETQEQNPGVFVAVNNDNDDNDFLDGQPVIDKNDATVVGENDLIQVKLQKITATAAQGGKYTLSFGDFGAQKIKIYKNPDKTGLVESSVTEFDPTEDNSVYVEGVAVSGMMRDVGLTLQLETDQNGGKVINGEDEVLFTVCEVNIKTVKGLYEDDGSYSAGYKSDDNKGKIYNNHVYNPNNLSQVTWVKNQQYVDLEVEILPANLVLPEDAKIVWVHSDPDDQSDEDTTTAMSPAAKRIIDSNDYDGSDKIGKIGDDNTGSKDGKSDWVQIPQSPYDLTNNRETKIVERISKVRFNMTDHGGDNFRVEAGIKLDPDQITGAGAGTGTMTIWTKLQVEYLQMAGAAFELQSMIPNLNQSLSTAFVEVAIGHARTEGGAADVPVMGSNNIDPEKASNDYVTEHFNHIGQGGWFFLGAARKYTLTSGVQNTLYDGQAEIDADSFETATDPTPGSPVLAFFYRGNETGRSNSTYFGAEKANNLRRYSVKPKDYHTVTSVDTAILDANLGTYGITNHSPRLVTVTTLGNYGTMGNATFGLDPLGAPGFNGGLLVYTQFMDTSTPEKLASAKAAALQTLVHEFVHALGFAHKCGNWDYKDAQPTARRSCTMNYEDMWIFSDPQPGADENAVRPLEPWTSDLMSDSLCPQHIKAIRKESLEDSPFYGW